MVRTYEQRDALGEAVGHREVVEEDLDTVIARIRARREDGEEDA